MTAGALPPLPEGEVETAAAVRVRDYGLSGESVIPHPLAFGESTSPSGRGGAPAPDTTRKPA
jgi:hypothetical protein